MVCSLRRSHSLFFSERFRTITTSYYRSSDAVLLVFDVTEEQSFKNAKKWLDDVREYAQEFVDVVLVGNKVDLEDKRVVDFETAKNFANENMMPYVETSAKNGLNVESVFMSISKTSLSQK